MNPVIAACALTGLVAADPEPVKPVTPERIKELVKKLEEPTRAMSDPKDGPPDYPWPTFNYRFRTEEIAELKCAGESAVPALLAMLEDKSKPGQARAQAVAVLIDRLIGTKIKPDPKIIAAVNEALKEKNPALRYGALIWLSSRGLALYRADWEMFKRNAEREKLSGRPPVKDGAIDLLNRLPPPEERSFTPEVMDAFLPQVITALTDEHPRIVTAAANTIYCFGRPNAGVHELLMAFKRQEPEVRAEVALALSRVGKDNPDALRVVLGELDHPERYENRYYYQRIVGAVGGFGPKAKDAVPVLIEIIGAHYFRYEWRPVNVAPSPVLLIELTKAYCFKIPPREGPHGTAINVLGAIGPDAKAVVPALLRIAERCDTPTSVLISTALDNIDPEAAKQVRAIEKRRQDEFARSPEYQRPPDMPIPLPPILPPPIRP